MSDQTERLARTLLDIQNTEAPWWRGLADKVLPEVVKRLERRFGNRYAVSAEDAVLSAVRVMIGTEREPRFETIEDVRGWLYTVAWRKAKDALEKEHLDVRGGDDLL